MSNVRFFKCETCGNIAVLVKDAGTPLSCCGKLMTQLAPNTVEAATEKHIPEVVVSEDTVTVKVGSVEHPMTEEHHIEFIYLLTEKGGQIKHLEIGDKPTASFKIVDDKVQSVYAYCNLHGLWKTDVEAGIADETVCSAEFVQGCI